VLQVRLLGGGRRRTPRRAALAAPPAGRLLAFLAARPGPHDREAAAAVLWPGSAGTAARANLRTAVWALRKAVSEDALVASRTAVGLRPNLDDLPADIVRSASGSA
jgi:DNA-binding SARP family transcriptional activator